MTTYRVKTGTDVILGSLTVLDPQPSGEAVIQTTRRSFAADGARDHEDVGGAEQPLRVVGQAEDGRAAIGRVGAHALEAPHPVVQRVREHVDLGITPGHVLAIHPDDPVSVRHTHRAIPINNPIIFVPRIQVPQLTVCP